MTIAGDDVLSEVRHEHEAVAVGLAEQKALAVARLRHRAMALAQQRLLLNARGSLLVFIAAAACYGTPQPGHEREALRRVQQRNDWLGILLPVLAAGLLVLVLITLRQRRSGKPAFAWLIRSWDERQAARLNPSTPAEVSTESAEAFTQMVEAEAEEEARRERKILARDGTTVLYVGQRLRIQTPIAVREGKLHDIDEEGLTLAPSGLAGNFQVPWDQVRRIDTQHGPERRRTIPWMFAIVGAGLLGFCGSVLDSIDRATAVLPKPQNAAALGAILGAVVAGLLGRIVMYALPGPRWRQLVAKVDESPPLSLATLPARASRWQRGVDQVESTPRGEIVARALIILIVFGMCALFSRG